MAFSTSKREKYGLKFNPDADDLEIELEMIRRGGRSPANPLALPLIEHFFEARRLCWPKRYRHRWTDLLYGEFLRNDVTILMGAASTQKTSHATEFVLLNYFARPENTIVIVSSINMDKLDTGVFGEMKMLWQMAHDRYDWLPGKVIEGKKAIATDEIDKDTVRDMRRGCIGKPCYVGGRWVGQGILSGIKQEYVFFIGDELQWMAETFLGSWPNLFSNEHVKIIGSGNPKHDPYDQLGLAAEPKAGWASVGIPERTITWETKFLNGRCVNLVGTDSPNFDTPEGEDEPYRKLIGRKFAKRIANDWGPESPQFFTQVKGVMRLDFAKARVLTRQLCREHHALETAQWRDDQRTKIGGLDPTYGGDDRCVAIPMEFGTGIDGTEILRPLGIEVCRINLASDKEPEEQIAEWLAGLSVQYGISPGDWGYDSTGKGTMGFYLAQKFGSNGPVPVASGDEPTDRPVRDGLLVQDKATGLLRAKTCREHYVKFVSELWFSVHYAIQANQIRELAESTMLEGCARIYSMSAGNKIEVEPKHSRDPRKKEDLKRRLGKSPDEMDTFAIGLEMARRRGFVIASLGPVTESPKEDRSLEQESEEYLKAIAENLLDHTV